MKSRSKLAQAKSGDDYKPPVVENYLATYVLRLYVTGSTPNSIRAVENLKRICERSIKDGYDLKVIDLYRQPEMAKLHDIIAAPTLLKLSPLPARKIIGDLSNEARVLDALGVSNK